MKLQFTKMQGAGNDFVVLNFVDNPIELSNEQFSDIADRRYGVGCDQILIVEKSTDPAADFCYRIINADGSEIGQCGNGARCLVKFIHQQGLSDKEVVTVKTQNSLMQLKVNEDNSVTVDMGHVTFSPDTIPFSTDIEQDMYILDVDKQEVKIAIANIGNPHCLVLADDIENAPVNIQGPIIESHSQFPERVNVSFMQMLSPDEIKLRVFERGSGETLACGSGACATVAMGHKLGLLSNNVKVNLLGGVLQVEISDSGHAIMTGPAEFSFTGEIEL